MAHRLRAEWRRDAPPLCSLPALCRCVVAWTRMVHRSRVGNSLGCVVRVHSHISSDARLRESLRFPPVTRTPADAPTRHPYRSGHLVRARQYGTSTRSPFQHSPIIQTRAPRHHLATRAPSAPLSIRQLMTTDHSLRDPQHATAPLRRHGLRVRPPSVRPESRSGSLQLAREAHSGTRPMKQPNVSHPTPPRHVGTLRGSMTPHMLHRRSATRRRGSACCCGRPWAPGALVRTALRSVRRGHRHSGRNAWHGTLVASHVSVLRGR